MGFKCGLVGLPNVGKSTIFNELTSLNVPAHNFPFCTIKPNVGTMFIPDSRLNKIASIVNSNRVIPTCIELVDIAGLVKGAHKGEGLGNKFLSHIKQTDLIIHVVRGFKNNAITHVYGRVNPIDDIEIVNLELIFSDLNTCIKRIDKIKNNNIFNKNKTHRELEILNRCLIFLKENKFLKFLNLTSEEIKVLNHLQLITLKPMIYVINMNHHIDDNDVFFKNISNIFKNKRFKFLYIHMNCKNKNSLQENKVVKNLELPLGKSGLSNIAKLGYEILKLKTFFTAGEKEVRAWTTNSGIKIFESVKCIHTDFSKGFIRAQVISYLDFIQYNGVKNVKKAGKVKLEGKDYFINDGDIINVLYKI